MREIATTGADSNGSRPDRRRVLSLRIRLTLSYTAAMVVVLAIYAAAVYTFVWNNASQTLDLGLQDEFEMFEMSKTMLLRAEDGAVKAAIEAGTPQDRRWWQVWAPTGDLIYQSAFAKYLRAPEGDRLAVNPDGQIHRVKIDAEAPPIRVLSKRSEIEHHPFVIQVARSELEIQQQLDELRRLLLLGLPLGVAFAGLGGYALARRALAPIEQMAERARTISAERLGDRLPVDNANDELGRLASVFNATLGRLEQSFERMRRFTADASHELRTPLTALRTVGEVGLRGKRDASAYRDIIGSMLEETGRLSLLVDRLLTLSRADNGEFQLAAETVSLAALAGEVAEQMGVLAEEKNQSIAVETSQDPQWTGDPLVLRQALMNLVDNAIKYTPEGGRIAIRVARSESEATVEVEDNGPGIPKELQGRIFDRFYRVDRSRSQADAGAGLGLSIAKWAVEVNGGRLTLNETSAASGSLFRITLPTPIPLNRTP